MKLMSMTTNQRVTAGLGVAAAVVIGAAVLMTEPASPPPTATYDPAPYIYAGDKPTLGYRRVLIPGRIYPQTEIKALWMTATFPSNTVSNPPPVVVNGAPTNALLFTRKLTNSLSATVAQIGQLDSNCFSGFFHFKLDSKGVHRFFQAKGTGNYPPYRPPPYSWSWYCDINPSGKLTLTVTKDAVTRQGYIESAATVLDTNSHTLQWAVDVKNPVMTNRMVMWLDRKRVATGYTQWPTVPVFQGPDVTWIGGAGTATNMYSFAGKLYNVALFSGRIPGIDELTTTNNGARDLSGVSNLWSLVRGDGLPLEQDAKQPVQWKNNNGVKQGGL